MSERDEALKEAIADFPIEAWARSNLEVRSSGSRVIYADCPFCKGKKKLGIYRYNRVATCGRCRDGGHGGEWGGTASLPKLIKLVENCSWRDAFQIIYSMAGLPEPAWTPDDSTQVVPQIPEDAIPLSGCSETEPAVQLLRKRHAGHLRDSAFICIGGRYHERIILPTYYRDTLTGFEAKAVSPSAQLKSLYADDMATDRTIYTMRSWIDGQKACMVTESVLDAETFASVGLNAIGCYGSFKEGHVLPLLELGVEELVWFLDGDVQWSKVWAAISHTLPFFTNYVVPMPDHEDPNNLGPHACLQLLGKKVVVKDNFDHIGAGLAWGKGL